MISRLEETNEISSFITNFSNDKKEKYFNYLKNTFGVLFTFHSNRIEGTNTTLTLNDTKSILNNTYDFKSIVDKNKLREVNETINHQNAFNYIFEVINEDLEIITIIKSLQLKN